MTIYCTLKKRHVRKRDINIEVINTDKTYTRHTINKILYVSQLKKNLSIEYVFEIEINYFR